MGVGANWSDGLPCGVVGLAGGVVGLAGVRGWCGGAAGLLHVGDAEGGTAARALDLIVGAIMWKH